MEHNIVFLNIVFCLGPPPPSNITISSNNPTQLIVSWIPHCTTSCDNNRIPKRFTIKYKSASSKDDERNVTSGNLTEFPPPNITLSDNLVSNTEYYVYVMTTVRDDEKMVNSDFTKPQQGFTGYKRVYFYSLSKLC